MDSFGKGKTLIAPSGGGVAGKCRLFGFANRRAGDDLAVKDKR